LAEQKKVADEETTATRDAVAALRAREDDLRDARDGVERERERVSLEALKATRMLERFQALDLTKTRRRVISRRRRISTPPSGVGKNSASPSRGSARTRRTSRRRSNAPSRC
jgi:hypothetical protein